jgi:hypothetical protein
MDAAGWGPEGPPPDAYARVTNPERFRPLHAFGEELADRLQATFDVERREGHALDPEVARDEEARPIVRLVPNADDAAPIGIIFTPFPGLNVRLGHWHSSSFPACGCDACDESPDEQIPQLDWLVDQVTNGRFREAIELPLVGAAWLQVEIWSPNGRWQTTKSRLTRADARMRVAQAGRARFDWGPWPRRRSPRN